MPKAHLFLRPCLAGSAFAWLLILSLPSQAGGLLSTADMQPAPLWQPALYMLFSKDILQEDDPLSIFRVDEKTKQLTEHFKDYTPEPLIIERNPEKTSREEADTIESSGFHDGIHEEKRERDVDPMVKIKDEQEQLIRKSFGTGGVTSPFERKEEEESDFTAKNDTMATVSVDTSKYADVFYIPDQPVATGNMSIHHFADNADKKKEAKKEGSDESDEEEEGSDSDEPVSSPEGASSQKTSHSEEDNSKALVLTEVQENISEEELLAPPTEPGLIETIYSWMPGIRPLVVTAAGTYLASMTGSKTLTAVAFLTFFLPSYIYYMFEETLHTPDYYIESRGRLSEAAESGVHQLVSRASTAEQHYFASAKAMPEISISKLFAEFCAKYNATEEQYPEFFTAFYLGVLITWSGVESLRTDETKEDGIELLRKRILRTARQTLLARRKKTKNSEPAEVTGHEIATPSQVENSLQHIILTAEGNLEELTTRLQDLLHGCYLLSGMRAVLSVSQTDNDKPYTIFYAMLKTEHHFRHAENLARYLNTFNRRIIATVLGFEELSQSAFGDNNLIKEYEEAFEFMEFDIDNPPTLKEIKEKYRTMARQMHPDRETGTHESFQRLQEAKLKIEDYLRLHSEGS